MTNSAKIIFDCPLPVWVAGAAAAVILAVVIIFLRRDVGQLSPLRRRVILALIVVAGLMLTALVLNPKLIRRWADPQNPVCAVLVDTSRSMLLSDTYRGEVGAWLREKLGGPANPKPPDLTREEVVKLLLGESDDGWLSGLKKAFDVSGWGFASAVQPLPLGDSAAPFQIDPEGYTTAIGEALNEISRPVGGARPRAIVLISDGAWNTGRDPSEIARVLGGLDTPVFVVGLGDPSPPRDAAVIDLKAPKSVLLGDELFITAQIAATGMGAGRVGVQLLGQRGVLQEKQVVTSPSSRAVSVTFSTVPGEPGRRLFTVRIPKQPGERDESNNSARVWVDVVERKVRILLVEGNPRWEFRFIRNVFERDPGVSLTVCLLRPGVGPIVGPGYLKELPADKKGFAGYDLVILGDVFRDKLPDTFLKELGEMVKHRGGSLIVIAGRQDHFRELAGTPVGEVLPVVLKGSYRTARTARRPFKVELTQEGASHLMMRLVGGADADENEASWMRLPALHWSAQVGGVVRGATALLVHPYRLAGASKLPLMAVHRVGTGKVMFCGIDETWRWRKAVGDKYHYRFWAQVVRWMAKRQFTEGDPRGRLSIDRNECGVGDTVQIEAYCLDPDGFPLQGARVRLRVEPEGGEPLEIAMPSAEGGWGIYRTGFTPSAPGKYRMRPIVSTYGEQPLSSSVSLEVSQLDLEKNFLAQDKNTLTAIAQTSGGEYLDISRVDRLPSLLVSKAEKRFLSAEYSPCRSWVYYVVLAAALGGAWLVRKRSGLA